MDHEEVYKRAYKMGYMEGVADVGNSSFCRGHVSRWRTFESGGDTE